MEIVKLIFGIVVGLFVLQFATYIITASYYRARKAYKPHEHMVLDVQHIFNDPQILKMADEIFHLRKTYERGDQ